MPYTQSQLIPVAVPSKACVCGHPLPGITGSNSAGACLSLMSVICCVGRGLCD